MKNVLEYYTKVRYKYKGGNYLLGLNEIGYAENPDYIIAIDKLLRIL